MGLVFVGGAGATAANVQRKHTAVGRREGKLGGRGKCALVGFLVSPFSRVASRGAKHCIFVFKPV